MSQTKEIHGAGDRSASSRSLVQKSQQKKKKSQTHRSTQVLPLAFTDLTRYIVQTYHCIVSSALLSGVRTSRLVRGRKRKWKKLAEGNESVKGKSNAQKERKKRMKSRGRKRRPGDRNEFGEMVYNAQTKTVLSPIPILQPPLQNNYQLRFARILESPPPCSWAGNLYRRGKDN